MIMPELVDGCRVKCKLCWNSYRYPPMTEMPLEIVEKVLERHHGDKIEWFNWGDPLLHKDIYKISEMVRFTNSRISSSLSLMMDEEKFAAVKNFKSIIVSISGMTGSVYNIYHRAGLFSLVVSNLHQLIRRENNIIIRWLGHKYNQHQYAQCKQFCEKHDLRFDPILLNATVEDMMNGIEDDLIGDKHSDAGKCRLLKWVPIGVDGSYLLCCASHNIKTGYTIFDDITPKQLLQRKLEMPFCIKCRERELWRRL